MKPVRVELERLAPLETFYDEVKESATRDPTIDMTKITRQRSRVREEALFFPHRYAFTTRLFSLLPGARRLR
jgi:hypothetical protein